MWEKDIYGIDGIATLLIEYSCGQGFLELYRGRFIFGKYSSSLGDECFIKMPIEAAGDIMELRNKWDQPVDLETLKGFDGVTDLPPYEALAKQVSLPSKGVSIQDYSISKETKTKTFIGIPTNIPTGGGPTNPVQGTMQYTLGLSADNISEIGSFIVESELQEEIHDAAAGIPGYVTGSYPAYYPKYSPLQTSAIINYAPDTPNYGAVTNPAQVNTNISGSIAVLNCSIFHAGIGFFKLPHRENADNGESPDDYVYLGHELIFATPSGDLNDAVQPGNTISFSFVLNSDVDFNDGDRFFLIIAVNDRKTADQQHYIEDNDAFGYSITINQNSFFKAENLSRTTATLCKLFMVNESISRVAEAITNGKIKGFSDYFGRTDSLPYSRPQDGCGAMEAITKGLFIRRQEQKLIDRPPVFSLSLKQLFEGLEPIHHIGFGIEADPNRPGYNCLRVENWKYFYSDEVVLNCSNINKIDRSVQENEHYSLFSFGYEKWEAEEYTGLDEFLTKRKYRTTLNSISNELNKLSKFIASGYAIEITRRKGNDDSKDWRYDNDTFIICMTRQQTYKVYFFAADNKMVVETYSDTGIFLVGSISISGTVSNNGTRDIFVTSISNPGDGQPSTVTVEFSGGTTVDEYSETVLFPSSNGLYVEQGNILAPENIIDPNSIYNYRISPVRNAMRWFDQIASGFKLPGKIIFTDGDGNFWAKGKYAGSCALEENAIAENDTIENSVFENPESAAPILQPERVVFDYDLSAADFRRIKENPYGLIAFSNEFESGLGWIDSVSAKHNEGMATFRLIPKK
ncbi:hypothetical protein ABDK00_014065 [Niabella insulamsoli]|uniref:hypothetical protein n=1 Tax=Niabella insulamsoli TaxID=3144874 RepID=UPI0031FD511D